MVRLLVPRDQMAQTMEDRPALDQTEVRVMVVLQVQADRPATDALLAQGVALGP